MKLTADEFEEIRYDKTRVIEDKITGHRRWSVDHTIIFKQGNELYRTNYSVAATESQDEYQPPHYECTRVVPVEKLVTVYEPIAEPGGAK